MDLKFSMSELIYSDTAVRNHINNMPDIRSLNNMLELIYYGLQPAREKINKPMIITSGFRSKQLNELIPGSVPNSQHTTGQAVDFIIYGMTPAQIIEQIKFYKIEFDQLIDEYGRWVHFSYVKGKNRHQILRY